MAGLVWVASLSCGRAPYEPQDNTWRFLPGQVQAFSIPQFRDGRQCWVYLPPGYAQSGKSYPVLYVTDGELVFDGKGTMHLNRIAEDLIRRGEISPLIIVAIAHKSTADRFMDLAPWSMPEDWWGYPSGGGDFFVRAIRDTLKPEIDRRYRTLPDRWNTALAGFSLGGLLATYAAYGYDSTFAKTAAFSGTYSWGDTMNLYAYARAKGRPHRPVRLYQDSGYPDDNYIDYMIELELQQGFSPGIDLMALTVEGAGHTEAAWEHRFPNALRFLFPPDPP